MTAFCKAPGMILQSVAWVGPSWSEERLGFYSLLCDFACVLSYALIGAIAPPTSLSTISTPRPAHPAKNGTLIHVDSGELL
jgi:hypothetical protein